MKFKKGDKFQVKKNGFCGQVVDVKSGSYAVKWDHFLNECYYDSNSCDEHWEHFKKISGGVLDYYLGVSLSKHTEGTVCSHAWKTYSGFTEEYEYCEKCDTKRK